MGIMALAKASVFLRLKESKIMNLYEVLHVSQDAPEEIIKLAYKGLAQKYHPDRYKGDDANEIMVKIREAYETLIDPIKRKNYDQFLAEQARRKQQQEEYVRKQQQEEFVRRQKAAFEQQNKANSSVQSDQSKAHTTSETQDSKSFKMNISIDIPKDFSIFSPFLKIKNWLVSKKRFFIRVGSTFIAIAFTITIASIATSYLENLSVKTDEYTDADTAASEAVMAASEAEAAADNVNLSTNNLVSNADHNLSEASYIENNEAQATADDTVLAAYHAGLIPELENNPSEIRASAQEAFKTFQESGIIGVKELISNCYFSNQNSKKCIYLDFAGKYIHDSGVSIGLPRHQFFDNEIAWQRIMNHFYIPNAVLPALVNEHSKQTMKQTYQEIEEVMINN